MELLVLLALVFLGLSVLIRRRGCHTGVRRAGALAPAALVIQNIVDPAAAQCMLVENADHFSNRPAPPFLVALEKSNGGQRGDGLTSVPYGPLWSALRRNLMAEALHPSRLGHIAPLQREATQGLIAALGKELPVVSVREHLSAAVFSVVARLCFGDDIDEGYLRAMRCGIRDIQLIAVVEAKPSSGSMLAKLTGDDELVLLVLEFLGAGAGTVAACLEWTLAHVVNDQEVQEKLSDEVQSAGGTVVSSSRSLIHGMPYLNAVVLESLRMHPTVPFIQRHVHADAAGFLGVGGTTSDLLMQVSVGAIGRYTKTWTDPDEFRPERFLPGGEAEDVGPLPGPKEIRMVPFGTGHRFCPGVGLAMMNIKCFLAALVHEFHWKPPTVGCAGVDVTELNTFVKGMKTPLSVRLTRRTLSS
ncbi:hypothetical protein CFC21_054986 [Triticum aestivum]|uniref:Cytochrome P450 n=1 Tax=Triticum aestivum TaxID=4565 RepID=A0A9R1GEA4_WHEAT|nr:hypothetical protein CFC21_054986 [Triticum aestivum]